MKIAIITPFAYPEQGACAYRVYSFYKFFTDNYNKVTIYAPYRSGVVSTEYIFRYKSILELFLNILKSDFDIIIGTSPPMTHSFFAMIAAKISGKKFILDLRDIWTYSINKLKLYNFWSKPFIYSIIENICYFFSDLVFVVTPGMVKFLEKKVHKEKLKLIMNGTDIHLFVPSKKNRTLVRKQHGLSENDIVIAYAGSFSDWKVEKLILVVSSLLRKNKNIFLFFIISINSNSNKFEKLKQIVAKENINNKVFMIDLSGLNFFDATIKVSKYLSAADLAISCNPADFYFSIQVKNYDYLSMNLPILTKGPKRGDLKDIFDNYEIGIYCTSWSCFKKEFKKIITNIKDFKERFKENRKVAKKFFLRKFSNIRALKEMEKLLNH